MRGPLVLLLAAALAAGEDADEYFDVGVSYLRNGFFGPARRAFGESLVQAPGQPVTLAFLGLATAAEGRPPAEAARALRAAYENLPEGKALRRDLATLLPSRKALRLLLDDYARRAARARAADLRDILSVAAFLEVHGDGRTPSLDRALQQLLLPIESPDNTASEFSFIDLFAGIGGIRLGFESAGGRCVFTSEWNEPSVRTYRTNFPDTHPIIGDITKVKAKDIPDHDVLLAGFPCQPFSIAGVSKKNSLGREHGFRCETQGTLFFVVERIIEKKQPKAFLLENVKHLLNHDKGRTFEVILRALRDKLGYEIHYKVIDARHFVPQHRSAFS